MLTLRVEGATLNQMAALSIKDFPDELYRQLKIQAATESKTLRDYVIGTLEQHIGGKGKSTREKKARKE